MEGGSNGEETQDKELAEQQADGNEAEAPDEQEEKLQVDAGKDSYEQKLAAKDAQIAELTAQVAEAARSAKAAQDLSKQIADLKQQMEDERVDHALETAGARSVKAARALLEEHDGDVAALVAAEPWLFDQHVPGTLQNGLQNHGSSTGGSTGLAPAGASGGSDSHDMARWEQIAGLTDESKE
jgi:membrane protein involved in colicin uptake